MIFYHISVDLLQLCKLSPAAMECRMFTAEPRHYLTSQQTTSPRAEMAVTAEMTRRRLYLYFTLFVKLNSRRCLWIAFLGELFCNECFCEDNLLYLNLLFNLAPTRGTIMVGWLEGTYITYLIIILDLC